MNWMPLHTLVYGEILLWSHSVVYPCGRCVCSSWRSPGYSWFFASTTVTGACKLGHLHSLTVSHKRIRQLNAAVWTCACLCVCVCACVCVNMCVPCVVWALGLLLHCSAVRWWGMGSYIRFSSQIKGIKMQHSFLPVLATSPRCQCTARIYSPLNIFCWQWNTLSSYNQFWCW